MRKEESIPRDKSKPKEVDKPYQYNEIGRRLDKVKADMRIYIAQKMLRDKQSTI